MIVRAQPTRRWNPITSKIFFILSNTPSKNMKMEEYRVSSCQHFTFHPFIFSLVFIPTGKNLILWFGYTGTGTRADILIGVSCKINWYTKSSQHRAHRRCNDFVNHKPCTDSPCVDGICTIYKRWTLLWSEKSMQILREGGRKNMY